MQRNSTKWSIATRIFQHANQTPEKIAIKILNIEITYKELWKTVTCLVNHLHQNDASLKIHHPTIVVWCSRSLETYAGIICASALGGKYIPINPKLPANRINEILSKIHPDVIICDKLTINKTWQLQLPASTIVVGEANNYYSSDLFEKNCFAQFAPLTPQENATNYVIFTSGTTGTPKGVAVSYNALQHFVTNITQIYEIDANDRIAQYSEPSFDFSVLDIHLAFEAGATLVVVPEQHLLAPGSFIRSNEITFWGSVPSVVTYMQKFGQLEPNAYPSLRISFFCGEALSCEAAKRWKLAAPNSLIDNHYGPTEATVACAYYRFNLGNDEQQNVPIGRAYPGMMVELLTEDSAFIESDGELGEILIAGPQLATEYISDAETSGKKFRNHSHPTFGSQRWYHTGDSGKWITDAAGNRNLTFVGRFDNQVKINGYRIELEDIECHLRNVTQSLNSAVVAWPTTPNSDSNAGTSIVAFCTPSSLNEQQIITLLKKNLPHYMIPRRVVFLDDIPRTQNGKIDRRFLIQFLENAK